MIIKYKKRYVCEMKQPLLARWKKEAALGKQASYIKTCNLGSCIIFSHLSAANDSLWFFIV